MQQVGLFKPKISYEDELSAMLLKVTGNYKQGSTSFRLSISFMGVIANPERDSYDNTNSAEMETLIECVTAKYLITNAPAPSVL